MYFRDQLSRGRCELRAKFGQKELVQYVIKKGLANSVPSALFSTKYEKDLSFDSLP